MGIRIATTVFVLCLPLYAEAQQDEPVPLQENMEQPEEVLITGQRLVLRTQMYKAELEAYDVFNKFNDDKRFDISCSMHKPTGTLIERQVCQAGFEREATRAHAQASLQDYRDLLDPYTPPGTSPTVHQPQEAVIAKHQQEYRRKMKQVAEEHPEFLEAIIRYSELREQYEKQTRTVEE